MLQPERSHDRGGPYLCVHLRRKDYVSSRSGQIPSIKGAADQVGHKASRQGVKLVYVASDAPQAEVDEFQKYIESSHGVRVHRFRPSSTEQLRDLKDGGVAIVDQIICSHAKYFIGSYESTFSFRIQEEREIMGFQPKTTFSMLCPDGKENCEKGSVWKVVYPARKPSPATTVDGHNRPLDEL